MLVLWLIAVAGSYKLWSPGFHGQSDLLLAYLPLAHILEQFLEYTFYLCGVPLGYASVKTLLDDSVRGCKGDLQAFRPVSVLPFIKSTELTSRLAWEGCRPCGR